MAISVSSTVSAQNLQLNQAPTIMETASSQWVVDLFANTGLTASIVEQTADSDTVQVTAPSGASFYVSARGCDGATPKNCNMLQTFALFDGAGVTLNQINSMVRDNFIVSYAFLGEDGNGVLATKIVLAGGVTKGNVLEELGAYLADIDNLIAAMSSGPRAEVNFDLKAHSAGVSTSKIHNGIATSDDHVVNKVGPNAPKFLTEETKALFD